ncbi:MAG: uroporphyrinogen-III synthase [Crocinitomicaceae bacterium]|nr:uroporphyrinogen-III synthase [Crocinitomicaceae bacterium]
MNKRIFISKNASDVEGLKVFTDSKNITLSAQSLISFEPEEAELNESFDLIFFGSPRSIIFFKAIHSLDSSQTIACVGKKTASLLKHLGVDPDYVVTRSGKIQESQNAFKQWVGDRTVLFPHSDRTLSTYSSILPKSQRVNLCVYKTILRSKPIEACDIYIFTSPSNYEAFKQKNKLLRDSYVIAWGESTANEIFSQGDHCNHVLTLSSIKELVEHLNLLS